MQIMEPGKIFLVLVQLLGLLLLCRAEASDNCRTPKGKPGQCKLLTQCKDLAAIIRQKTIETEDSDYLRKSHCGGFGSQTKVCCPLPEVTLRGSAGRNGATNFCQTSRREQGECKIVTSCPIFLSILRSKSVNSEDADYMRNSQCGLEGTLPKVCCPFQVTPVSSNLLPSLDVCGIQLGDRIIGGNETGLKEYPWMALLEYKDDVSGTQGFLCGGALINKRYVLTAAHCLKEQQLNSFKLINIRLGEHNTDTDSDCADVNGKWICNPAPINIPVEKKIVHEGYNDRDVNQYHDIALVRLARDVQFTDNVKPICLPTMAEIQAASLVDTRLKVAGWGKTESKSESSMKLALEVPYQPSTFCASTYGNAGIKLTNSQLCAGGERGKDSCQGDSGGPLMTLFRDNQRNLNWYSIGVVSFGPTRCGMDKWPGIYTKVDNYVQWIVSNLEA